MVFTGDENARLSIEEWKLMVGRLPGGVNTQADGVAKMCANVAPPFLNLSTPERPAVDGTDLRGLGGGRRIWTENNDEFDGDVGGGVRRRSSCGG